MLDQIKFLHDELEAARLAEEQKQQNREQKNSPIKKDLLDSSSRAKHFKQLEFSSKAHKSNPPKTTKEQKVKKIDIDEEWNTKETPYDSLEVGHIKPLEKLQAQGVASLSNLELLCLLLGSGNCEQAVEQLAAKILPVLFKEPLATNLETLKGIKGMGLDQSSCILAAMEFARRLPSPAIKQLNTPEAIHKQILHFADQQENLIALNLNGACETLSIRLITRGTVNRSLVHPREVFTHAIREQANGIIIAHNHPSGHLEPSTEDFKSTKRLQEAAKILGITLFDHIIFSETDYFSMSEHGFV